MMANAGGAWEIRPYHTTGDGNQLFTKAGRRQLEVETSNWERIAQAVALILRTAESRRNAGTSARSGGAKTW